MVAAAVVGSAVVGAAATSYSGRRAADAQRDAARESGQTELEMFYQNRADFAPYRETGTAALNQLAQLYGVAPDSYTQPMSYDEFVSSDKYIEPEVSTISVPGRRVGRGPVRNTTQEIINGLTAQEQYDQYVSGFQPERVEGGSGAPDYSAFYESPDYNFTYDQGMRAVEQSLARRGLGGPENSGAAMKELTRFGQGLASQQFNNYRNSLAAMAGIGQTATSQLGAMGQQVAANVGAGQRAAGDARASSYLNQGQAVSNIADSYAQYSLLQAGGYLG